MKMGTERYELSDFTSETSLAATGKKNGGCYVSTAFGFLLALLAILIAVGIGIIVHFAGPAREFECHCSFPDNNGGNTGGQVGDTTKQPMSTTTPPSLEDQCVALAEQGNQPICNACPKDSVPTCAPPTEPTSTPAPTTKPKVTDVRIPLALIPELYTVELQPDMYGSDASKFTFNGSVTITLLCKENANNVTLHTNKLNYTGDIRVYEEGSTTNLYGTHTFDMERQFIIISTVLPLTANKRYKVEITQFIGPLKNDLHGLYLSQYKRDNETISIATTQFQPTDARKTFPCYDEPAIKSEFEITLLRKKHMKSLSNMPIDRTDDRGNDWVADVYERSPKMPTYLLAFIVCDFNYTQNTTQGNVTYRAWSRPEAIDQTPYSLSVGVEILDYFEDYFNISYPLPKQDMIAIPDFAAGAMENWGLITYRETAMLYEPGVSSEGNKQRVAVVVSHELAHQWFGNLVTPSWWDDLWLNEGFASYVEYMGVDHVHPDWKMFEQFVVVDVQDVFDFDGLISSHPVYVPVAHPDEINEIFDRISYAKGASIIRMMRFFLGDDTFRWGLYNYLWKLRYGAAFHDDLWFALGNQSIAEGTNMNVKGIMDTWTLQMNYPTVMVDFSSDGQIRMSQSRYLRDPNATDPGKYVSPFGYKWEIPFTFTTSEEMRWNQTSTDVIWMHKDGSSVHFQNADRIPAATENNWVIGNVMQYGYYRVNYDMRNWNALITQLNTDHTAIHEINRAQIINDAWNLAKSGDLDMSIALKTTEYLGKEREYVPWSAANGELGYVNTMLKRTGLYGSFEKYMKDKASPLFNELGMNNTGATHLQSYMRSTAVSLACGYGIQACIDNATQLFALWMSNPDNNPIDPGLKTTVYCTAVAEGGQEEWDFAFQQYQTANVAAEKSRLLSALSCSKHVWLLSRFLEMSIDDTIIRKQDSTGVMVGISRNTIGRTLVWDFFRAKWDYLLEEYGISIFAFAGLIGGVSSSFNTEFELMQLKEFIADQDNLGSGARAFQQAVEKTQSNVQWMETNVPIIRQWLTSQGY